MGERAADERRYTAFLSYSHKDAAAASRLHRRLETYRMPKRLIGLETAQGTVPERLAPIFRDRDELPAATDLSETVREALAGSGALVVLCSPHAAGSLWVAEEIRVFRELHPDRPILAAVLEGDPPDCFPAALRAFGRDGTWHEPLATDLRPHRDGPRLGLLKLVAGITGVGLDALVQRDASRRVRRVTAVTVGAVVAMLIMAALALVALDARREAERQQAEAERQRAAAEGQIEFMLTDLRNRLRGSVGQIEVMQAVNARALSYYAAQDMGGLSADSLLRRARVLHAIGEDDLTQGNYPGALAAFRAAYRTTAEQLARSPTDLQRLYDHAQSEYWIGRVAELRHDWPAAQRQYIRFAAATERLIAAAPQNPDYMMRLAWSAIDLGNVQLYGTRDYIAAQHSYEKAARWFGRAGRARPRDENAPRGQANAYGYLADSFLATGQRVGALAARTRQHRILEQLHRRAPANADYIFRLALAQRGLASALASDGDRQRARPLMFQAYDLSLGLTRRDPRNADWLLANAIVACELYYGRLGLPPGVSRARLSDGIRGAHAVLGAQDNPHAADIANCARALGRH